MASAEKQGTSTHLEYADSSMNEDLTSDMVIGEDLNEDDLEIIDASDFVEAHTVDMDCGEANDDNKLVIDEDYDTESCSEGEQNDTFAGYIEDDRTKALTNKFLNGELTFSEYAAMMEGDDDTSETDAITTSSSTVCEIDSLDQGPESNMLKSTSCDKTIIRRRRKTLPPALQGLMGEANLRYARGEKDVAIKMCLEIIRQVPTAPQPFQTLAVLYEELGAPDKSLQFALIAAHLSPNDVDQWIRLAVMSEEQGDIKQAITCYSKAISADQTNINIHMKRAMLMEQIGDKKTALRAYQRLLSVLTPEDGPTVTEIAKMLAYKFHKDGEVVKAKEAMETMFKKVPHIVSSEHVNLMLELKIELKEYSECLEILVQHCGITLEFESTNNLATPFKVLNCTMHKSLAIDLHVKLVIILIHFKAFHILDQLLQPLELANPEEAGDLYLDVAEALIEERRHSDALRLLNPLLETEHYGLAAVWLRQADCLSACGQLEEAIASYEVVMNLAPQHVEARFKMSGLLKTLGRGDEALAVLTQDAESEVLDPGLLYEKCMLLKGDEGRTEEFLAVVQLFFSRHFVRIRNRDELHALSKVRRLTKKQEALKEIRISRGEPHFDADCPDFVVGKNSPTVETEWKLFLEACNICYKTKKFDLLQRFAFSALGSKLFFNFDKSREIEFLCLLACLYNNDAYYGYNLARDQILREMKYPRIWNLFNLVLQRADDVRHNRFLMRLLSRHHNNCALTLLHANNCLVAGTYKYALSEYVILFRTHSSNAMFAFMVGVTLFQMACQKFSAKKHSLVTQALAFFWKYQQIRGEEGSQESHYNIGRAFHQLGLLPVAIYHYKKVLNFESPLIEKYPHLLNLKQEAAFNLYLIYMGSGARDIARSYVDKYIVV